MTEPIKTSRLYITTVSEVKHYHDKNITHLISIRDHGDRKPYFAHFPRRPDYYDLQFSDVREHDEINKNYIPNDGNMSHLIRIGKYIKELYDKGQEVNILLHCTAGVSRSTAAAYIIMNILLGEGNENTCLNMVYAARSCMIPNELMVQIADRLLDRKGNMLAPILKYNSQFDFNE